MKGFIRFKKMTYIIYAVAAVLFIFINLYVIHLANNFAEKHGAVRYEIGYHEISGTTGRGGLERDKPQEVMIPSYFTFYTSDDRDLMDVKDLNSEYNRFNVTVRNYYDGYLITISIIFGISLIGIVYSSLRRYHFFGYVIATIVSFLIFVGVSWLNTGAYISSFFLLLSSYMVYKSRFVDYNQSFFSLDWLIKRNQTNIY